MQEININFFGTNNFAKVILEGLIKNTSFVIYKVITMPDRPAGRKKELKMSAVKELALKHKLEIEQPEKLDDIKYSSDFLNIVIDYGIIIPSNIIDNPRFGSINIHPSMLPKYRGASPIQSAILNGDDRTGVTIMVMDDKMDHGPILVQNEVEILKDDKTPELNQRIAQIASQLLLSTIPSYISGQIKPVEQDHDKATVCKLISREDGIINFEKKAREIYDQFRAYTPWPGIYTIIKSDDKKYDGLKIKLIDIEIVNREMEKGTIIFEKDCIYIGCSSESIKINIIQLEGKKAMSANVFINGHNGLNNSKLE